MDDLLNEAMSTAYLSTIDLRSGYHEVKVAEEDQDKIAFTCPFGTCKFTRMPFGLQNAPATFQRLIDKFRSGLKNVLALSYLDDIIIFSPTFQKHISNLEKVHHPWSRPTSVQGKADCDILAVFVNFPTRSPKKVRQEQLKDTELKKIVGCFENNEKGVDFANWLEKGYLMNQGLYSVTHLLLKVKRPIQNRHDVWEDKLLSIRFALNSVKCDTTGKVAAYLQFGREMISIDDVTNDFRAIINNENFVPEITPYLKRLARTSPEIPKRIKEKQDQ
ncbi:retrovirus-related Pol polyprotein from transposon 297 [Trichonephila clavipes]|nr:retrovirus-related Pol polyprotein from transposon 297 [Trichonephila clavipes]